MALVLKTGKTFYDSYADENSSTCYAVVDQCNGNKKNKTQHFDFEIYKSASARAAGAKPIYNTHFTVSGDDFDTYFSTSSLATSDQYKKAYEYIVTVTDPLVQIFDENGDPVLDENNNPTYEPTTYTWGDWESDE